MNHLRKKLIISGLLILFFGANCIDAKLLVNNKYSFSLSAYALADQNEICEKVFYKYFQALQNKDMNALKELYAVPEKVEYDLSSQMIPEKVVITKTEFNGDKVILNVTGTFSDKGEVNGRAVLIKDGQNWKFFDQLWNFQTAINPNNIVGVVTPVDEDSNKKAINNKDEEETPSKLHIEKSTSLVHEVLQPQNVQVMYQAQSYIMTPPPAPISPYYTPEMSQVPEVLPPPEEAIQHIQPDLTPEKQLKPASTNSQQIQQASIQGTDSKPQAKTTTGNSNITGKIHVTKRDGDGYLRFQLLNDKDINYSHTFKIDNPGIDINEATYSINELTEGDYTLSGTYYFTNKYKEVYHLSCGKRTINIKNGDNKTDVDFYCK